MSTKTMKNVMALGAGGALVAGAVAIATASPSRAMPVLANTAAVSTAVSIQVADVHNYRRGYCGHCFYGRSFYGPRYGGGTYGYPLWGYPYPYYYSYYYPYFYPFAYGGSW
jgi:hypothetical protein